MKKFDKTVFCMIKTMNEKDDLSKIKWNKVSNKLFNKQYTPNKFKGMRIGNAKDWRRFICYYSMNKAGIEADWIAKELKEEKPVINESSLDMADILNDALEELKEEKVI